jgi:hypothetical protein
VWTPNEPADWAPYHDGSWSWCEPFGWTWVGAEPWGWAPYHYGTWIHRGWGWAWVPGPVTQCWSPGVVNFAYYDGEVCWAPLAPWEVHYPAFFDLGVYGSDWGFYFSIPFCGCYFPVNDRWCEAQRWDSRWLNHWHNGAFHGQPFVPGGGAGWANSHFTPAASKWGAATRTKVSDLGERRSYERADQTYAGRAFSEGQVVGAPGGHEPVSGPVSVARPSGHSWTAGRATVTHPNDTQVVNRPVYRSSNPAGGRSGWGSSFGGNWSGGQYRSGADAAEAARRSLGWEPSGRSGSAEDTSHGNTSSRSRSSGRGWSVPDHSGWSHSHSDTRSGSGGGSRGGEGGRGH